MFNNPVLAVNIAANTYCNLKCPYCFANNMFQDMGHTDLSLEMLDKILTWLDETARHQQLRIGIIGGEPTLHPQLSEIITKYNQFSKKHFPNIINTIIFSNGILLQPYIELLDHWQILLNINSPQIIGNNNYQKIITTLNTIKDKDAFVPHPETHAMICTVGCNLYQELNDYSFFWDIMDEYNIKATRFSVTAPMGNAINDKDKYYLSMKNKLLEFIEQAVKRDILLIADCNQIPYCYFTSDELSLIYKVKALPSVHVPICEPTIDISPSFTASSCFGMSSGLNEEHFDKIDCTQFETLEQLSFYMLHKRLMPKFLHNNTGQCAKCKDFELLKCQGGCLIFSQYNKEIDE